MNNIEMLECYRALLVDMLVNANGPLLHGDELRHLLGFESGGAMRSSLSRELLPIVLMEFPYRQGKFSLSEEVAIWLFNQRNKRVPVLSLPLDTVKALSDVQLNTYLRRYGFLLHEVKIMELLRIDTRKELMRRHKKDLLPFAVFQLDNHRTKMFALLPEIILYLESTNNFDDRSI